MRARGTRGNPPNRFEPVRLEPTPEAAAELEERNPATQLRADPSRTIVATNESPDVGFDASVNPYRGCEHGCVYCMSPDTPVLGANMVWRPIGELRIGDELGHPFVAARAVATLDILSGGRAEVGIGAGWLRQEWSAAGLDPRTRGRRLDEALAVCKRLWSEPVVEHRGEFFAFPPVAFEPKPVQKPWPKVHVGGESEAALGRAAASADGWYGLAHDLDSAAAIVRRLRELRRAAGRERERFEVTLGGEIREPDDVKRWEDAGVDRLTVSPWRRSREALEGLRRFADLVLG